VPAIGFLVVGGADDELLEYRNGEQAAEEEIRPEMDRTPGGTEREDDRASG